MNFLSDTRVVFGWGINGWGLSCLTGGPLHASGSIESVSGLLLPHVCCFAICGGFFAEGGFRGARVGLSCMHAQCRQSAQGQDAAGGAKGVPRTLHGDCPSEQTQSPQPLAHTILWRAAPGRDDVFEFKYSPGPACGPI